MWMGSLKRVSITSDMIAEFIRGDEINNPIVAALKEQCFPDATEILLHGDELYIDRVLYQPTIQMIRWMNAWNTGRKVEPCILGYYEP
jgi:hypothetical protein